MLPNPSKPRHADGDGQHHHYFVPTVHFDSCRNAKIYVNTIINHPCSSPPSENVPTTNRGKKKSKTFSIDPDEGGRVDIYCGSEKLSVEIQKLSSEGTSEINPMTCVTMVHQNNVSGKEIVVAVSNAEGRAIDQIIGADNAILNSTGKINVGPGAGGNNSGDRSASINIDQRKSKF